GRKALQTLRREGIATGDREVVLLPVLLDSKARLPLAFSQLAQPLLQPVGSVTVGLEVGVELILLEGVGIAAGDLLGELRSGRLVADTDDRAAADPVDMDVTRQKARRLVHTQTGHRCGWRAGPADQLEQRADYPLGEGGWRIQEFGVAIERF